MKNLKQIRSPRTLRNILLIRVLPLVLLMLAFGAIQVFSQETRPTNSVENSAAIQPAPNGEPETPALDDPFAVCNQRLLKALDGFKNAKTEIVTKDGEIASQKAELKTKDGIIASQNAFYGNLLKAVALLTSSERRDKNFFEKLKSRLGDLLKTATDPQYIATIIGLIVVVNQLKK